MSSCLLRKTTLRTVAAAASGDQRVVAICAVQCQTGSHGRCCPDCRSTRYLTHGDPSRASDDLPAGGSFQFPALVDRDRRTRMKLTGAQALIKSLECEGVEVMFGLPGGCILPAYDPIIDSPIRHILVRHEQGAGHMAEGYAHVTGRPGVAMVTSGPGATNIVTPLADAMMDSIPIVVITGQVPTTAIGTDAFQEVPITGVTLDITKHNWLITDVNDIPRVVAEAFHVATTGRPGPVLIDMPKDIAQANMVWYIDQ